MSGCPSRVTGIRARAATEITSGPKERLQFPFSRLYANTRPGCRVGERTYAEGEMVRDIEWKAACDNCFCAMGAVRCVPLACAPPLQDCSPIVREGQCCPSTYNCSEFTRKFAIGFVVVLHHPGAGSPRARISLFTDKVTRRNSASSHGPLDGSLQRVSNASSAKRYRKLSEHVTLLFCLPFFVIYKHPTRSFTRSKRRERKNVENNVTVEKSFD